jgi:hypothetical protein
MRTLGIWLLLLLASQSIFAENTITIIGDTDDGYYFDQLVKITLQFYPDGRLRHAYEEITYRDSRNRTEALYEITIERNDNTFTASGYFNNRGGDLIDFITLEYTYDADANSYSISYPNGERETDGKFLTRTNNSYGRLTGGEWPEVLTVYDDRISFTDEKRGEMIVDLVLDQNGRVIEIHNGNRIVATATPLENSIEIHEIPIEGSATEYEIIIGEDYVPPQELHIRAFNVFITSLAGHAVYFPFLVGYF